MTSLTAHPSSASHALIAHLQQTAPFHHLDRATLSDLAAALRLRRCTTGEIIDDIGAAPGPVYLFAAGRARLACLLADGTEVTLDLLDVGDLCGVPVTEDADTAFALHILANDTLLFHLPRPELLRLMAAHPALAFTAINQGWRQLARMHTRLVEISAYTVRTRLARTLTQLAANQEAQVVGVTRETLGVLVGASREHVTRTLEELRADDLISYAAHGRAITLHDRERLAAL